MPRCDLKEPGKNHFHQGAIGTVPDEVLLDIFDFYRQDVIDSRDGNWRWRTLVHVCRRWRHIVLTSPRRLDLRLLCTTGTPVRKYLDCWPPTFSIAIKYKHPFSQDVFNIFVALENPVRVCSIELLATCSLLEKVSRVMQVPFPALKNLSLEATDSKPVSQGFLSGVSVPGLQKFSLCSYTPSALPKFLLSCKDLVDLQLSGLPPPHHFPPEVIVTILSSLSRLKVLTICFSTLPYSRSSRLDLHPRSTRTTLSDLTFYGSGEYMEDLMARIDTPFLQRISLYYWHRLTDAPQLRQMLCRTEGLRSPNQARIIKHERAISLRFRSTGSPIARYPPIRFQFDNFNIVLSIHDWQFSSAVQFCLQSVPLTSGVKRLIVESTAEQALWTEVIGLADWLDLFRPFSAVEELYVDQVLGSPVAFALAGATGNAEILPALRSVFFYSKGAKESASLKKTIKPFFAARKLSMSDCHVSGYSVDRF